MPIGTYEGRRMNTHTQEHTITLCQRMLPVKRGQLHPIVPILREVGYHVTPTEDSLLDPDASEIVWIQGNTTWFPKVCRQLVATPRPNRPFVVHWLHEPLPMPDAAGIPRPRLNLREVAKILLRDARVNDVYSNYFRLSNLARKGVPDLLVTSTLARCEFLAQHGIAAFWAPLAYEPSVHGHAMALTRDIDVLYLGVQSSRRKRVLRRLRRRGVPLQAMGSWSDPTYWGEHRTQLLNRTKIFLNIAIILGNCRVSV